MGIAVSHVPEAWSTGFGPLSETDDGYRSTIRDQRQVTAVGVTEGQHR